MEAPHPAAQASARRRSLLIRLLKGGTEGNARLTALTALILLLLLTVEGVTILAIRPLLSVHVFVGLLLIPPILLKLASTGFRFVRYYRRDNEYVRKGPPMLLMRMLVAPGLVAATIGVFATGIALLVVGPEGGIILLLHKASFVVWSAAFGVHALAYTLRVPSLVRAEWRGSTRAAGETPLHARHAVARHRIDHRVRCATGCAPLASRSGIRPLVSRVKRRILSDSSSL